MNPTHTTVPPLGVAASDSQATSTSKNQPTNHAMKSFNALCSVALGLALAASAHAQTETVAAPSDENSSLLGKRYVGATFGYLDVNDMNRGAFGGGLSVNLPVAANVDVSLGGAHSWLEGDNDFHTEEVIASATYFIERGALRPYVTGALGHAEVSFPGPFEDDFGFFGVDVGAEYQINSTVSVNTYVTYGDTFESGDNSAWSASVQLNYWVRSDISVGGRVSLIEEGDVAYGLGAAWVF